MRSFNIFLNDGLTESLTGLEFKNRRDWKTAEAWLRKHRTAAGIDDASIRRELRDLMRKRKAISGGRSTS